MIQFLTLSVRAPSHSVKETRFGPFPGGKDAESTSSPPDFVLTFQGGLNQSTHKDRVKRLLCGWCGKQSAHVLASGFLAIKGKQFHNYFTSELLQL